jgi:hypothetical protein
VFWTNYGSMSLVLLMHGVSKRVLQLYSSTAWRVLRKRLHLKAYKLSIVEHLIRLYAFECKCFLTLATQQHLECHCKALFETLPTTTVSVTTTLGWLPNAGLANYEQGGIWKETAWLRLQLQHDNDQETLRLELTTWHKKQLSMEL